MRRLNGSYTQRFNWRHQRVGHLMQGRFKRLVVERESYLLELCQYVALNPVRAGLVGNPADWAWSSYGATVGLRPTPPWLDVADALGLFDADQGRAQQAYRQFVADGMGAPSPWSQITGQIFLGSPAFRKRLTAHLPTGQPPNVPRAHTNPTRLTTDEILTCVSQVYGVPPTALVRRSHAEAYQTAVWLLRRAANEPFADGGRAIWGFSVTGFKDSIGR